MLRPNEGLFFLLFVFLSVSAFIHMLAYYIISRIFYYPLFTPHSDQYTTDPFRPQFTLPPFLPDDSPLLNRPAVRRYAHCFAAVFSTGFLAVFLGLALKPWGLIFLGIPLAFYITTQILWRLLDRDAFSDTSSNDQNHKT